MQLQPIVYTTDMGAAVRWWSLVLGVEPAYASEVWTSFDVGGAVFALHGADSLPDGSRCEMSLVSHEPLETVIERLAVGGLEPMAPIVIQDFGRQVGYRDPDGNIVQINEHRS
jgi:catechol 2,3-dioxygenase-like lactoylglutathione lyase family enzyme